MEEKYDVINNNNKKNLKDQQLQFIFLSNINPTDSRII